MVLTTSPNRWSGKHIALRAAQIVVTAVALFWSWFALAVALGEGTKSLRYAALFVLPLTTLAFVVWKWPRIGGVLLISAGVFEFIYLANPAPRMWMATPSIIAGLTLLLVGSSAKPA